MIYNVSMKMANLLENDDAAGIFSGFFPGMMKMMDQNPQALQLSVEQLVKYSKIPEAAFSIWQSESLLGPYEIVENLYNPGGHKAGDFDLVSDGEQVRDIYTLMLIMRL